MPVDSITPLIIEYRYWILIPLAFLEGPIVAFSAGLLASLGYFNPFIVLSVLIGKDISVDAFFYLLGRWGNRGELIKRYSRKVGVTAEHWDVVERLWDQHPWKTMFLSKIAYGLSYPFLVSAGLTNISYKRFWLYAIQISLLQYGLLMVLGYYFGNSYGFVAATFSGIQILLGIVAVIAVIYYGFSFFVRRRMLHKQDSQRRR